MIIFSIFATVPFSKFCDCFNCFHRDNYIEMHIYFDYLKIHDVMQVPRYASVKDIMCKYWMI